VGLPYILIHECLERACDQTASWHPDYVTTVQLGLDATIELTRRLIREGCVLQLGVPSTSRGAQRIEDCEAPTRLSTRNGSDECRWCRFY